MTLGEIFVPLGRFLEVRSDELRRVGFLAALLFFLLAANNVIKVVRDSLFLSRFPITQLPYVYLLAAATAGVIIAIYSKYTARLSLPHIILTSLALVIFNVLLFWALITYYQAGWVLYAYYMWSAIAGLILVAQFWTLAANLFTPRDGKRLFGIIAAGGTTGGMIGGMVSSWAVQFLFTTNQLLWLVAGLLAGAFAVTYLAFNEQNPPDVSNDRDKDAPNAGEIRDSNGVMRTILGSPYLQTVGAMIFVSVIVSTLIDYQFKATAKLSYDSADALAGFFGSYYGWLSLVTMLAQLWLTGKLLTQWGLVPSLLVLPASLLAGSFALLAWPGLAAATATRLTEAALRTSVNQSGVQILYLPMADAIRKKLKVFMDVTVERLGDGAAALIILFYSLLLGGLEATLLSYVSIGFVTVWIMLVFRANAGYVDALRHSLTYREASLETANLDFADKKTMDAVLATLVGQDERSILFALDLLEKAKRATVTVPRQLLRHPSGEVRRRALMLLARSPNPDLLNELPGLLASNDTAVQTEVIKTVANILRKDAIALVRPFLHNDHPEVRRAAIDGLLRYGDDDARHAAFAAFDRLLEESGPDGAMARVEAARLMGDWEEPAFSDKLSKLISDDSSPAVIREALAAAARRGCVEAIPVIISRLCCTGIQSVARDALVQYGEIAIEPLRQALSDRRVVRDARLYIPRTLSKIHAQPAMNALLGGLLEEDRAIRFQVILAIEEMARHLPDLKVDREIIENAIISDALLYSRRFVVFHALYGDGKEVSEQRDSLLYFALTDSMERIRERVAWLLELLYPAKDIRRAWAGFTSTDHNQHAYAVEFLDNLLAGNMKKYAFALYSDDRSEERLRCAAELADAGSMDAQAALTVLLHQDDVWLKVSAIWEVARRGLGGFRDMIAEMTNSPDLLLSETARVVSAKI